MRKLFFLALILCTTVLSAQQKLDALEFQGKVTTVIRDAYVVPTGGSMLIWNLDTQQFEYADDSQTWLALVGLSPADQGKLDNILITQSVDLDQLEADVANMGDPDWATIQNIPADIADGDDDTPQLTKLEIEAMGFVDGPHTTVTGSETAFNGWDKDSSDDALDTDVVHLAGGEDITGIKTFSGSYTILKGGDGPYVAGLTWDDNGKASRWPLPSSLSGGEGEIWMYQGTLNMRKSTQTQQGATFDQNNTDIRTYTFPDASGTVALTSDITTQLGSYLPLAGGTMTGDINMGLKDINDVVNIGIRDLSNTTTTNINIDNTTKDFFIDPTTLGADMLSFDKSASNWLWGNNTLATSADLAALAANGTGIVAEGVYTIAGGSNTYTVTHNLGYVPALTRIQLQAIDQDQVVILKVETPTATTFDIDSSSSTLTGNIAWRIFGTDTATPLDGGELVTAVNTELGNTDWQTGGSGDITKTADYTTLAAITGMVDGDIVQVTADGIGGLFKYDSSFSATDDGGVVKDGWVRQYDGDANIKWWEVKGDGVTDDTAAVQTAFDWADDSTLYIPEGEYVLTNTVWITGSPTTIPTKFISKKIYGSGSGYNELIQTKFIATTIVDKPIFAISAGRNVHIQGISVQGGNIEPNVLGLNNSSDPADYVTIGFRTDRYSPQCGFAIDPNNGATPPTGGGYSGMTYQNAGYYSAAITFRDVEVTNNVVNVMLAPNVGAYQQEMVIFEDCIMKRSLHNIAWGQSQARANAVRGGDYSFSYISFDGTTYGTQQGVPPSISDCQFVYNYALVRFPNSFNASLKINNIHAEAFETIGRWGAGFTSIKNPAIITGSTFSFGVPSTSNLPAPFIFETHSATQFKGCTFNDVNNSLDYVININGSTGTTTVDEISFEECAFKVSINNFPLIGRRIDLNAPHSTFKNCIIIPTGGATRQLTDDYRRNYTTLDRMEVQQSFRSIQNKKDYYVVQYDDTNEYENVTVNGTTGNRYTFGATTVTFSVSEQDILMVDDVINWDMLNPIGGYEGIYPALRVSSVTPNGGVDDIVATMLFETTAYDVAYDPTVVQLQKKEWILDPDVQITGDLTSGSPVIANMTNESNLKVGDWLSSNIYGIVTNARVISVGSGTVTMNKNANGNVTGANLFKNQLIKVTDTNVDVSNSTFTAPDGSGNLAATTNTIQELVDEVDALTTSGGIQSDITGRTNAVAITNKYSQPYDDYISDGDPGAGIEVTVTGAPPMEVETVSSSITLDGFRGADDQTADTASFTVDGAKTGGVYQVIIDRATAPTITGSTIMPDTQAFVAATKMSLTFVVNADGSVSHKYAKL